MRNTFVKSWVAVCLGGIVGFLGGVGQPAWGQAAAGSNRVDPAIGRAMTRALDLRREGRLDEAIAALDEALLDRPDSEELQYERLSMKSARGTLGESEQAAFSAMREERQAATELAVGAVRLGTLRARSKLAAGRFTEAEAAARAALDRLAALPADVDRAPLRAPLDEVLTAVAEARRMGAKALVNGTPVLTASDMGAVAQEQGGGAASQSTAASSDQSGVSPGQALGTTTTGEPGGMVETAPGSASRHEIVTPPSPIAAGGVSRPERIDANFEAFADARLQRWGEDPQIYQRVLAYPSNWPMICRMRQEYASGLLYRGPDFVGDDGQTKYTAVYDIADLTADIPHFNSAPVLDLTAMMQAHADRVALRQYSDIFVGNAADLAAGIPLLGYFGGVDEYHVPPISPGTQYQYQDILRMVDDVLSEK